MPVEGNGHGVTRAVVLGSGRMAPGLAAALVAAGCSVTVCGRVPGRARLAADAGARLAGRDVGSAGIEEAALRDADLVLETVVEDVAAKHEVLGRIEPWLRDDALVATNTSSLRVGDIAEGLARPERMLALHFLFPAHRSPLVEVMGGPRTPPEALERGVALARAMGKVPIRVGRDSAGLVWNRLQFALLREALHLLEEGVADAATIDACVELGLGRRWVATGPLTTAELGGLDTFALVAGQLFPDLSAATEPPARLRDGVRPMSEAERTAAARLREVALEATEPVAEVRRALLEP
jgi:3-hydroxybutyryl-CoA dehydrogenase